MNEPYPPGGGEPYPGGGQPYPGGGQSYPGGGGPYPGGGQPYPPGWESPPPPGPQPSYGVYPAGPSPYSPYGQAPVPPPPQSIRTAVTLMYVGAGLEVLGLIFSLISRSGSTASEIPGAIIGIGLWIWMARANQAGKNWARITSTVFFGIDCLGLLLIVVGVGVLMHSASSSLKAVLVLSVVAAVVTWVLGLVTVVLLWRRESSEYYAAMKGR
jgi:hypothetical protein